MRILPLFAAAALVLAGCLEHPAEERTRPHADDGPRVYFVNLENNDQVTSPFRVVFGVSGMGVAPSGVIKPNTGHHHLLVDETLEGEELEYAIPADENHIHFGDGQTETVLDLEPGVHYLQLVFGDLNHEQFDPPLMSERIVINVVEDE